MSIQYFFARTFGRNGQGETANGVGPPPPGFKLAQMVSNPGNYPIFDNPGGTQGFARLLTDNNRIWQWDTTDLYATEFLCVFTKEIA